jgi:hypothetical protein
MPGTLATAGAAPRGAWAAPRARHWRARGRQQAQPRGGQAGFCYFGRAARRAFLPSVSTRSAPNALSRMRRSTDMLSGIVSTSLYPRADATNARPTPVLPLVGSTCSNASVSFHHFLVEAFTTLHYSEGCMCRQQTELCI